MGRTPRYALLLALPLANACFSPQDDVGVDATSGSSGAVMMDGSGGTDGGTADATDEGTDDGGSSDDSSVDGDGSSGGSGDETSTGSDETDGAQCTAAADCDDGDPCNGDETCDEGMCVDGEPPSCEDGNDCTADVCEPGRGCINPVIDEDGDGHSPTSAGACGTDCDDTRDDVNPEQDESCDDVDHDCDGDPLPLGTDVWYVDCDADGFAAADATALASCEVPPPDACGGSWTLQAPMDGATTDCCDDDAGAHPDQTSWFTTPKDSGGFDYNCDGSEELRYNNVDADEGSCVNLGGCVGVPGWTASTAPACGQAGTYSTCLDNCAGAPICCVRFETVVTQGCR